MGNSSHQLACWDLVLTIGRYAGCRLNDAPLTWAEAQRLDRSIRQHGRPMVTLNERAFFEAIAREPRPSASIVARATGNGC